MVSAKDLQIKPITASVARAFIKRHHYSGKVVANSQLHLGVFLGSGLEGVMQFGCPMNKRGSINLVSETRWDGMIELNRMAFSEKLPRNSESRAIAIAMRMIRKHYPQLEWVVSFADGTQCGDGTIYRASGFVLTGIKRNATILKMPDGEIMADKTLNNANYKAIGQSAGYWKKRGASALEGYQFRYVYFLNAAARARLTVDIIPFSKIDEMGAGMYKGKARVKQAKSGDQLECGGAAPTHTLQQTAE